MWLLLLVVVMMVVIVYGGELVPDVDQKVPAIVTAV